MFKEGVFGRIFAIKPKTEEVTIDPNKVLKNLKVYLTSFEKTNPRTGVESVYGMDAQKLIVEYLNKLECGDIQYEKMDSRVFRMLWEHKYMMYDRLKKVEDTLGLDSHISEQYKQLVEDSDKMRMLYASHHKKRRDSVLPIIRNMLEKLISKERVLLEDFKEAMISCGCHDRV